MFILMEQLAKVKMMFDSFYMVTSTQPKSKLERIMFVLR